MLLTFVDVTLSLHIYSELKNFLAKIDYKLSIEESLAEGLTDEPVLGYGYMQKKNNKKDFFWVLEKHLVPTRILQKFIANATKSDAPEHVKRKFINQLQWYLDIWNWLYRAYVFINEVAN